MIVKTGSLQDTSASIFWELSPWKASSVLGLTACQMSAVVIEEERDFFCSLLSVPAKEAGLRDPPLTEEEVQRGQSWYKLLSALWLYPCFSECGHQRSFNYGMLRFLPDFLSHSKESSVSGAGRGVVVVVVVCVNLKLLWTGSLDRNKVFWVACSKSLCVPAGYCSLYLVTKGTNETEGDRSVIDARGGCFRNIISDTWDFLPHDALETKTFSGIWKLMNLPRLFE